MTRLTKWVTLRKQGLELIDPTEDGANQFQHYGDFNALYTERYQCCERYSGITCSTGRYSLRVPRQMLGVIEQRDAVENVK
jgi:hypothetical protein